MRKLGSIILCLTLMLTGCAKETVITLVTDEIKVNVHDTLSDETILSYVQCNKSACPQDMAFDIYKNDLDLDKVGKYTIDVMVSGSGYPLHVNVVDVEAPTMEVKDFSVNQYENIIWNRAMFEQIG